MLRPASFEVEFDAPGTVYFSDQTINGKVVLEILEPLNLKGVKMRFIGECCIHFTDKPRSLRSMPRRGKRRVDCASPINSNPRVRHSNGMSNGVSNPCYIPDEFIKDESSPNSGSALRRPRSSESAWSEASVRGPVQHYKAQETYFDYQFYIYGHKYQKDEKELIPAGRHEFPFAFSLPPNLPPSFCSELGYIRYYAVATLDRPAAANLVKKASFSVNAILDLNMDSHANGTVSGSCSRNLCCFCCMTGPITLAVRIPRKGYVPGERILVSAEADNVSARNTRRTRLLLLQVVSYIMPNGIKTKVVERVVKEIVRGMIAPGESDMWEQVAIKVPPLVPANLHLTCRLLHVEYRLDMILEPPVPSKDLRVSLPLYIGSVPLRSRFDTFLPPTETRKSDEGLPGVPYNNFPAYGFGECFFGTETLEGQQERVMGYSEDFGPQFDAVTPYSPTYILYKTGNNVKKDL